MPSLVLVALGGALGAIARATMSAAIDARFPSRLPGGTIAVNLVGCLLLGVLAGALAARPHLPASWRTFAAVGTLGAFTTFSTFEYETLALLQRGAIGAALANVGLSVVLGLLAVWAGLAIGRML